MGSIGGYVFTTQVSYARRADIHTQIHLSYARALVQPCALTGTYTGRAKLMVTTDVELDICRNSRSHPGAGLARRVARKTRLDKRNWTKQKPCRHRPRTPCGLPDLILQQKSST